MDTSISYHTEIEQLSTILGMTCRHLPQMPRLECGYNPYHPRNAEALLDVFREFDSLIIRRKRKTHRRPDNYILMADCVDALRNIRNDVASIMLDERLSGYVTIGLNHLRSLPAWANSPFHLKTWEELESLQNNSESSAQGFHDLVVQIAEESGLEIKTIKDWIHLASASPLASQDPFVQDAIDEHNMCNLSCRISVDENTLKILEKFYPADLLSPYYIAFDRIRNFWFRGRVVWRGFRLTEEARDWLNNNPRKRSKNRSQDIPWSHNILESATPFEVFLDSLGV